MEKKIILHEPTMFILNINITRERQNQINSNIKNNKIYIYIERYYFVCYF